MNPTIGEFAYGLLKSATRIFFVGEGSNKKSEQGAAARGGAPAMVPERPFYSHLVAIKSSLSSLAVVIAIPAMVDIFTSVFEMLWESLGKE